MNERKTNNFKLWLKRIGWAGFLFFLIKGLIWLAVFWFAGSKIFG
ncbi:alanyl-tRNA synthetase [Parafilimonas sp.]